jgi:hypothetical protein
MLNCEKNAFPHIHSAYYYDYRDIDPKPERQELRLESVENSPRRSEVQSLAVRLEWRRGWGRSLFGLSSVHSSVENLQRSVNPALRARRAGNLSCGVVHSQWKAA